MFHLNQPRFCWFCIERVFKRNFTNITIEPGRPLPAVSIIILAHWAYSFLMVVVLHSEPPLCAKVLLLPSVLLAVEFCEELNGVSK